MNNIHEKARRLVESGEPIALATILACRGSTPRGPGAHMIIRGDGSLVGTVGGGAGEAEVAHEAGRVLGTGVARRYSLEMWADESSPEGMVCGGSAEIWIEPIRRETDLPWLSMVSRGVAGGEERVVVRRIDAAPADGAGVVAVLDRNGTPLWKSDHYSALPAGALEPHDTIQFIPGSADHQFATERVLPSESLIIVGGGHISMPLCSIATSIGFTVSVIDDREEFAAPERFPTASATFHGKYGEVIASIPSDERSYFALVTRGFRADVDTLRILLTKPHRYIGMIGSRRRTETVRRVLLEDGVDQEVLDTVQAPIGFRIGADTPEEIAVSIAAELIQVRRIGKRGKQPAVTTGE